MAGSGKSHWSGELERLGFRCYCCDDLIAKRLGPELAKPDGTVMSLGEWMGFPYERLYEQREARYLECERDALSEILETLEKRADRPGEQIVVDTTGSVIYTGEEILERLRRCATVVHLSTPPEVKERMLQVYISKPRPVLWRGLFSREIPETDAEALARCYPSLLFTRERLYERYADVTVNYTRRNQTGFDVNEFLLEIKRVIIKQ
ncbi:MAG: hypothetical protein JSU72_13755 [Deltaproteobacteria bacterium]|nr:MAG: hypothetical protein JSU72_13755 [Deltaproteobacteria bacterium]